MDQQLVSTYFEGLSVGLNPVVEVHYRSELKTLNFWCQTWVSYFHYQITKNMASNFSPKHFLFAGDPTFIVFAHYNFFLYWFYILQRSASKYHKVKHLLRIGIVYSYILSSVLVVWSLPHKVLSSEQGSTYMVGFVDMGELMWYTV